MKKSWNKGIPMREESKKKLSEKLKGKVPWNRGFKGYLAGEKNPMYGKTHTLEARSKIVRAKVGKRLSLETRKKMGESHKKRIEETGIKPTNWAIGNGDHPWSTKEYNATRFSYFAGLFDGEGSVMILSDGRQMGNNADNRYKKVVVSFTMCDEESLFEGYKYFGGSLHKRPARGNGRGYWQWKIESGKQIDFFLRNIRKFVRIKGERIDLAMQYRNRLKSKINIGGRRLLTKIELELRNNIEKELKKLNKRGI